MYCENHIWKAIDETDQRKREEKERVDCPSPESTGPFSAKEQTVPSPAPIFQQTRLPRSFVLSAFYVCYLNLIFRVYQQSH